MKFYDYLKSIYFNFKYLPLKQAIKLPIILHNAYFDDMQGKVIIDCDHIYRGMIHIGNWGVSLFPAKYGIVWQNHGGTVVFKGKCGIGAGSVISINKRAELEFGDDFLNSAVFKVVASRKIRFGRSCRLGWNTFVLDTNMHPLKDLQTNKKGKGGANIIIGDYNWFGTNCVILPGVETPERIICGLGTIVTRNVNWESYCLYGGSPIRKLRENVYRDLNDDKDDEVFK